MVGTISLVFFLLILLASIRGWIPQHILSLQSLMVLGTLVLIGLALVTGRPFRPAQLMAATTLHPITATIAGFLLAGAVEATGGFEAAGRVLSRMGKGFLGLSGVVVLLVNIPTLFAMPCGRVWAAALIPVTLMFGRALSARMETPNLSAIIVFGLVVNAAASCGPSPLGGIGMMGEGTAGFAMHIFSNPQQMAIMIITILSMAAIKGYFKLMAVSIKSEKLFTDGTSSETLPNTAYFSFFSYMVGLAIIFITQPPIPIQTILLGLTVIVMIIGKVNLKQLMAGIILHPVTAMVAGFMMAGALLVTGGFDAMIRILAWLANHTPLGFIGVSVMLIYMPAIFPMPCGRIIAAALLPGVIMFGQVVSQSTGYTQCFPAILVAFILCCATSCAPSPLGGIGGIGEGNLSLKHGVAAKPLQFGIILGVPLAALIVTYLGLSKEVFRLSESALALSLGAVSGIAINLLLGFKAWKVGGIWGGLIVGGMILVI